jgi:hypothetical protein
VLLAEAVNETTAPVCDQRAIKAIGNVLKSFFFMMFEVDPHLIILFSKIDLSDGFWRMVVQLGAEFNFAYVVPGPGPLRLALPTALQMGWKNSPGFFCTATESACALAHHLLQDTSDSHDLPSHHLEDKFLPPKLPERNLAPPTEVPFLIRVYLDDYCKAAAISHDSLATLKWITRAVLHAIHAIFPPPEVTGHQGGKDSISMKKLDQLDGLWDFIKEMLGFELNGDERTISITDDKAAAYIVILERALEKTAILAVTLRTISGKMQHIGLISPTIKGFMTPINRSLAQNDEHGSIGLGKNNKLREVLQHCKFLVQELRTRPTHIRELVSPYLPHIYGYTDSCCLGTGGVFLPCTEWVHPTVWIWEYPRELQVRLRERKNQDGVTVNDGEMAGTVVQHMLLEHLLPIKYLSSVSFCDNSPSVGQHDKKATRSDSPVPDKFQRAWATWRHARAAGPADIIYWPGPENDMADFASRKVQLSDSNFLSQFSQRFPLPAQLGSWRLVRLPKKMSSLVYSILENQPLELQNWTAPTGELGQLSVTPLDTTRSCPPGSKTVPWNASSCSWPLLNGFGNVDPIMASKLADRKSRSRYANAPKYSTESDIKIPVDLR